MIGIDLNDTEELRRQLQAIFHDNEPNQDWHTIFVVEGVLMYLQADRAIAALQLCSDMATGPASLCFADRLLNFSHCDPIPMQQQLLQTGWVLKEWAPSPTANAKHMGIARTVH
jgi:O-methyltransferase involved in polyketide biosynthesis